MYACTNVVAVVVASYMYIVYRLIYLQTPAVNVTASMHIAVYDKQTEEFASIFRYVHVYDCLGCYSCNKYCNLIG